MRSDKKVSFPEFNHYNYALKYFIEQGLEADYVMAPQMTVRTMDRGAKNSPDYVCTPFKTTLGSMMDALEAGADTLYNGNGSVPFRLLCRASGAGAPRSGL